MHDIHIDGFDGPLHLLLQLVQRHELDITAISLVAVADEYLEAIDAARERDPREVGAFVEIGAKLAYLKSRALLPQPEPELPCEDDLDGNPVAQELVERLNEYRRFAEAFDELEYRQEEQLRLFPRLAPIDIEDFGPGLGTTTTAMLQKLMVDVLSRKPEVEDPTRRARVPRQRVSIREHIDLLRARLRRERRFAFRDALEACRTRAEVIVSFLALLELLKSGACEARQEQAWGEIEIVSAEPEPVVVHRAAPVRESANVA